MGHSEDDVVHKIPQNENSLAESAENFDRIEYKNIDVTLVQCPFKGVLHPRRVFGLFLHFSHQLQHIDNK